ncbi:MAG: ATP-dependent DNA helicase RecG [Candidatus Komeilibacteria bacterium]|jgi:ATP-dependent DNA helicase RecG|nr:ATP-dependent DNA helicase RecG [Candidatus Komeilibacteria bacterium]MBT4447965.1 ATP-dependent DNA helicase RecG [Candidatus Komeilibacteria bacterium]
MKSSDLNLHSNVKDLHAIAANLSSGLKKMNIKTIEDLLWYFPYRYDDLSEIKKISDISDSEINTVLVKITKIKSYRAWRAKMMITELVAEDDSGQIEAIWFRQKFVSQILKVGDEVYLSGKVKKKKDTWQFISPSYEKDKPELIHSGRLVPIYHLSGKVTQKQLRFLINKSLKDVGDIDDPLPVEILNKEKFPWLQESLEQIHFPSDKDNLKKASQRLKFQELFYLQIKYKLAKQDYQSQDTYQIPLDNKLTNSLLKDLPFKLTLDQQKALYDILADLNKEMPMNRLLEGDVGSGKTIVAILAGLNAISSDLQVALMAPTEILASQHFKNIKKLLPKKYLKDIAILTRTSQELGNTKKITKSSLAKKISSGDLKFIIGTHSLIQDKINFNSLGLVIIDEQHRFGVKQRKALKNKNKDNRAPHLLSMTATPIPRTLSLTLYGDLDISLIKEKPAGRQDIKTFLVPDQKRADAYKFILDKIKNKEQAFIICPLIDESDKLGVKSVTSEYKKLNKDIFPDLDIRMLHGKLKSEAKEKIMEDFKNNKFPMLVATSVIEVGVDIPGATMMIIESAERFGLSQLHQFRGRIGRNNKESFCMLFTTDSSHNDKTRLQALSKTNDGFKLADLDLELRGSGEVFGNKQTGLIRLKIAKLSETRLIKKAQKWAQKILSDQKYLNRQDLQNTIEALKTEAHLE